MMLRILTTACALALLLPSCNSVNKAPAERLVLADNERVLWDALVLAIRGEDYRVGATGADPVARSITSAWKLDLVSFRGKGNRTRVIADYAPSEQIGRDGYESFDVSVRVEKELNMSLVRQYDPSYAKWKATDDDEIAARRIVQSLEASLGTGQIEFKEVEDPYDLR